MTDVFISYSHQNKDFVHKLREALNSSEIILQRPERLSTTVTLRSAITTLAGSSKNREILTWLRRNIW